VTLSGFVRGALVLACVGMLLTGAQAGSGTAGPSTPARAGTASGAAATEPLRIMPLGASSTVGTGSASTAGYRGPLQQRMAAHGIAVELVGSQHDGPASVPDRDHEGHGGWTLARMAPRVAAWVRDARPDVVLLHAGTNDLIQGASAQVAAQRLDMVLDAIHEVSDVHVIVAGIWAPLPARAPARAEFDALAAAVVAEHGAEGRSASYADTAELLTSTDLADGLHPNAAGYQRIAAMWEEQIMATVATT
jgi:acyl-CoA thioesterase I